MSDKISTQAARKIAEKFIDVTEGDDGISEDALLQICFDADRFAAGFAPLIAAEYGPVMELMREAVAHPKFESDGAGGIRYYITEQEIAKARKLLGLELLTKSQEEL